LKIDSTIRKRLAAIESELARLENAKFDFERQAAPIDKLDALFRDALKEAWESSF
jgi:hypothetical protein